MMVGHCQTHPHPHHHHQHQHYHPRHHHNVQRAGSESSTTTRDEQFSNSGTNSTTSSGNSNNSSPSEYSLTLSSETGDRSRHLSTASLLDSIERRTQRTYRYGIGLVCVGATLNWLGFAQGTTYIDPLRYLGVACVLTGSFCVCLAMCRWLGRPISVSGHHVTNLEEERSNGDVHVINVAVPMYVPSLQDDYRPTKPPDYEQIVAGEPPPYDEAIKLSPGAFITSPGLDGGNLYASHYNSSTQCQVSPSHHISTTHTTSTDLTRALLLDNEHEDTSYRSTPSHRQLALLGDSDEFGGGDPPPAYEPSPRPSISSCSSSAPLIPTPTSRFELPPSFAIRRLFGGGGIITGTHNTPPPPAQNSSSYSTPHSSPQRIFNLNEHLHEIVVDDSVVQNAYVPVSSVELSNNNNNLNNEDERIV